MIENEEPENYIVYEEGHIGTYPADLNQSLIYI